MFSGGTEVKHWLEISGSNIKNSSEERVERKIRSSVKRY